MSTPPPLGPLVQSAGPALYPPRTPLDGRYASVVPLRREHSASLYKHLGGASNLWRWTYLPTATGGLPTPEESDDAVAAWVESRDRVFYAVLTGPASDPASEAAGLLSYLAIVPDHRRVEVGFVILGDALKHTRQATEAFYLFVRHAFRDLGYLRVEWKANELNAASLAAARRLGFAYEGVFRKHMVVEGRRRDTAWFSITDDEWPHVEQGFEAWLDESNFDENGKQRRGLRECRERAVV